MQFAKKRSLHPAAFDIWQNILGAGTISPKGHYIIYPIESEGISKSLLIASTATGCRREITNAWDASCLDSGKFGIFRLGRDTVEIV
jgi:hypothetical protein